jgi:murein L,D-transpeptidase YafK
LKGALLVHQMQATYFKTQKKRGFRGFFVLFLISLIIPGSSVSQETGSPEITEPASPESGSQQLSESDSQQLSETASRQIPDVLLPFDTEDSTDYIVVVEKDTQQLFLYANDGTLRQVYQMNCSTGKVRGAKEVSGDLKTPEGVYFFVKEFEDKELAPIYGTRAFPMDYPNLLDRIAGLTGDSIWLHGTNKPLKERDSSGCVALENANLDDIAKYITLNRTPIIIVKKLSYQDTPEAKAEIKTSVLRVLSEWKDAVEKGTYHNYLSFYDPEYLPNISWWPEWIKIRRKIQALPDSFSVNLKKILIVRYNEIYVVLCDQVISFAGRDIPAGTRKFYLTKALLKIIGEEYLGLPSSLEGDEPLIIASRNLKHKDDAEDDIAAMVDNWLKAWSSKDITAYGSFYARDFRSGSMDLDAWLKHKERLNQKYSYIRVSKENMVIQNTKERCIVSFVQTYESDAYKAVGTKQLILKRENGQWKIYRETWKKM